MFDKLVETSKKYFPELKVLYKDESVLMKVLKYLIFFNPKFSTSFTTTFGNTIYFPSRAYVASRDLSCSVVFLHELIHIYDSESHGFFQKLLFNISYVFPQILALLVIPLLFLVPWYFALIPLVFLAPLPAYWRMKSERKAYFISMYVMRQMEIKTGVKYHIEDNKRYFTNQFRGPNYYFMWIFPGISKQFDAAWDKISNNQRPFEDEKLFNMIDEIIKTV